IRKRPSITDLRREQGLAQLFAIRHRRRHRYLPPPLPRRDQCLSVRLEDERASVMPERSVERASIEENPRVRLVRDEVDGLRRLFEDAGEGLKLIRLQDAPARVVGSVENERPRPRSDGAFDGADRKLEAGLWQ